MKQTRITDCIIKTLGLERNRLWKGPTGNWVYPWLEDVLEECGLVSIDQYIRRQRQTIVEYVATRPIFTDCREGEWEQGTPHCQWWWEQEMSLDKDTSNLAYSSDGSDTLVSSNSCWG